MKYLRRCAAVAALICVSFSFSAAPFLKTALAQQTAVPAATLNFRDVVALALNAVGSRLLVADASTNQAAIFDTSDTEEPQRLQSITLEGTPLSATWINRDDGEFALVIVETDDAMLLQVLAVGSAREGWVPYAIYDLSGRPEHITAASTGDWAAAYGPDSLHLMEIISGDEINSSSINGESTSAAALTPESLLTSVSDSPTIIVGDMSSGPEVVNAVAVNLDDNIVAMAAGSNDLAAILTDAPELILFEPTTRELVATAPMRGSADQLVFMPFADVDNFAIFQSGAQTLSLLPIVRGRAGTPQTIAVANPVQLAVGAGNLLATSDGQQVDFYIVQ